MRTHTTHTVVQSVQVLCYKSEVADSIPDAVIGVFH